LKSAQAELRIGAAKQGKMPSQRRLPSEYLGSPVAFQKASKDILVLYI